MPFDPIFDQVQAALGDVEKTLVPFRNNHEGFAFIHQEFDHLWSEIKKPTHLSNSDSIRIEAIHLTAMTLRFLQDCT